ncbi:hypothetical protein CP532_4932 [Ophiocordyceps camponoti-leonardi (nom. inval.)]|nr:hypothetical protein CP532_4932 [Ophiocordyceps camponoti-leonardi (nom. inval.)]
MVRLRPLYLSLLASAVTTVTAADEKAADQKNATDSKAPSGTDVKCLQSLQPPALPLPTFPPELLSQAEIDDSCVPTSLAPQAETLMSQLNRYSSYVQAVTKTCPLPASLASDYKFLTKFDQLAAQMTVCPSGYEPGKASKTPSSPVAAADATKITSSPASSQKESGKSKDSSPTPSKTSDSAQASKTADKSSNGATLKAGFAVAVAAAGFAVLVL